MDHPFLGLMDGGTKGEQSGEQGSLPSTPTLGTMEE
jgi:hypothetical protein